MPEENAVIDANQAASSPADSTLLSSPDYVVPTGDPPAGGGDNADAEAKAAAEAEAAKAAAAKENERFDQHPRFQELIAERNKEKEARAAAEAKLDMLKKSPVGGENIVTDAEGKPVEVKDISKMSADELREWQEDDPKGYAANMLALATQQIKANIMAESSREQTISSIEKTFSEYGKANPTFNTMWDDGTIPQFMKENPGHNAISAHMALTREAEIKAAVEKAQKETEERVVKNFQAKKNATVISPAPASRGAETVDSAVQNTEPYGGFINVAANRLAAMRRASGG